MACGPIMIVTPRKPTTVPAPFAGVMRSSRVSAWARATVNSGVVALRIAARPPVISVCPQTIRVKGIRLLSAPMTKKARHSRAPRGSARPAARARASSASAPIATRANTTLSGGRPSSASSAKKNEPPQSSERVIRSAHSVGFMEVLIIVGDRLVRGRHGGGARP